MATISNLKELLKKMKPTLQEEKYYIAAVDKSQLFGLAGYMQYIVCVYLEEEGLTVVFTEPLLQIIEQATEEKVAGPFALITLSVNSDLMAVGFLAKISGALAKEEISVNAFSAYYHDHLLVPYEKRNAAMKALKKLQG